MAGQGRRTGTGRARKTGSAQTAPAETTTPALEPAGVVAELVDERTVAIGGGHATGAGLRLGRSLPGAIVGSILVVGLAFGSALGDGGIFGPASDTAGHDGDTVATDSKDGHDWLDDVSAKGDDEPVDKDTAGADEAPATEKPDQVAEPTKAPAPEPTKKPVSEPAPKPVVKPAPTKPPVTTISFAVVIKEHHPLLEWGSCAGLDFDYYKVVRSKDSTVTWPTGAGDELVAAVGADGERRFYDKGAPHGVKVFYRVFCVSKSEAGYKVLRASATKGIAVPEEPAPPTPPDPIDLALEAGLNGEGQVVLDWSACNVEGFAFYKVLRSTTNDDPSYLPWHDGTQVIGVVENPGATGWTDAGADGGVTVWYRVQCIGYVDGYKFLLGETPAVAVTMP